MRAHKHLLADTEPPSSPFALFGFVAPDQTKTAAEFAPPAVCVGVCATVARTSFRVFEPKRMMSALMDASAIHASLTVNGRLTISSVIR